MDITSFTIHIDIAGTTRTERHEGETWGSLTSTLRTRGLPTGVHVTIHEDGHDVARGWATMTPQGIWSTYDRLA